MPQPRLKPPRHQGSYRVALIDPPWTFKTYSDKGKGRSAENHYECMALDEIAALPVAQWLAKRSVVFLWATVPHLENALAVLADWGHPYKSSMVWRKTGRKATGYWFRNEHEILLVGARGTRVCPRFNGILVEGSVIEAPQKEHSRKPDEFAALIERYYPEPHDLKLEMFARPPHRRGWDTWGLEANAT